MTVTAEYQRRLGVWSDIQGHLEFLYDTVRAYDQPVVIELGVNTGNSTSALLAGALAVEGELWSCDVLDPHVPDSWHDEPRWHLTIGDDLSMAVLLALPQKCDVLFIDSDHSYGHVLGQLKKYISRVKPGGIVLLHDTQWHPHGDTDLGVPEGQVAQAIRDYCGPRDILWTNRPGSYGLGIIRL